MVSWALVGMPLRMELEDFSLGPHSCGHLGLLFKLKIFLPIWNLTIQEVKTTPDQWVAKEAKAHSSISGLHKHRGGGEQSYRNYWDENASQSETRSLLRERRRW